MLLAAEHPVTVENIMAVNAVSLGMGKGYKKMFDRNNTSDENGKTPGESLTEEDAKALIEELNDREKMEI